MNDCSRQNPAYRPTPTFLYLRRIAAIIAAQNAVINMWMCPDPSNTSKYAQLAKCSNDTALPDIHDLKNMEILIQNSDKGGSTIYSLPRLDFS